MSNKNTNEVISPELEKALNECTNLPTLPAVALKIIDASKDPDISLHQVSKIISSDPAISLKLLKVANSPLYSQRRTLNNLREALTLLGFNASLTIALSFSLLQSLGNNAGASQQSYWKRSILSASIARILGVRLHVPNLEDLFLASLLQDIGILVIQCVARSPYPNGENDNFKHAERIQFEKDSLGVDHSVVGAWLLKSWNLPEKLVNAVKYSHSINIDNIELSKSETYFHYCLNLSGSLADVWLTDDYNDLLPSLLEVTRSILDTSDEEFNQVVTDIDNALPEIEAMFEIVLVGNDEREKIIYTARELLLERSIHSIKQSEDDRRYIESVTDRAEKIEKASRLDHLTGVYNRQHIDSLLEREYEEANINQWPLSLVFIDIDDFKIINDTFGHLVGDEVLKLISEFFTNNIRETDVLARYGGDEFLLMLPGSTSDITYSMLERLLKLFRSEVKLEVKGISIESSISLGIATHLGENDFDSLKDFIAAADEALYKAKSAGKNCMEIYQ